MQQLMKSIAFGALLLASPALAQEAKPGPIDKPPAIDFGAAVKDAKGKPFPTCIPDKNSTPEQVKGCAEPTSLSYAVYASLNAPQPRQPGAAPSPQEAKDAALGWRIYQSTAPLDITTDERAAIKAALFRALGPAIAYASCRMIVPPDECAK